MDAVVAALLAVGAVLLLPVAAFVVLVVVALFGARHDTDAAERFNDELAAEPDLHPEFVASLRDNGWIPPPCCRDVLWGVDRFGSGNPWWPDVVDAARLAWTAERMHAEPPTDDELRRIVDKLREPE